MYLIPSYSMLASTATTLMLSAIFLILSHQSKKNFMRLWGISWMIYSAMFLLDFVNLQLRLAPVYYSMLRQLAAQIGSYLFLRGTCHFFQRKPPKALLYTALFFCLLTFLYPFSNFIYHLTVIPGVICCSGMLIGAGCMFIAFSWTQHLPEKLLASFFIIIWGIFINHFGFALEYQNLALATYFIGLFTVNILILTLIIIYFKKLRFLDTRQSYRFRLLVENSSDSMFLYDYKLQRFEYVSPTIFHLIGVTDRQLYDMPDRFFDCVNTMEKQKQIVNIFSRPITQPGKGILCLYKNGSIVKWSEIHYIPIRDNMGAVSAIEGILRDITERKLMEEDLKAADQAKKELLENVSHEIKTPVTLIQGYAESLLDKVIPMEAWNTYLKMIRSKAMMLTTLVDDLAQVSHFTSQSLEFRFYEQSAAELFSELLNQGEFHVAQAGRKAVVSCHIEESAVLIVDPYRIQQVISNLISNSIRHTPIGNEIFISCKTCPDVKESGRSSTSQEESHDIPKGELVFTVSDTGDGISEVDLPHIFERNFSGGTKVNPTAPNQSHSGLGLFISTQIIKQHSGRIAASNNQYGGAELSFTLPYYI